MNNNIKAFINDIKDKKTVAIFSHNNPDGDAVGSSLGMYYFLSYLNIKSDIFFYNFNYERFDFIKNINNIINTSNNINIDKYDALIALDTCTIDSLGIFSNYFKNKNKKTYNLDHHIANTNFADINLVINKNSNASNIYDLFKICNFEITSDIANALLLGIISDTNIFSNPGVNYEDLLVASNLVSYKADISLIIKSMYFSRTMSSVKLQSIMIDKIKCYYNDKLIISCLSLNDFKKSNSTIYDIDEFCGYLLTIRNVEISVLLTEIEMNVFKISFRSKKHNVCDIAHKFGGGGHKLASGAMVKDTQQNIINIIINESKFLFN